MQFEIGNQYRITDAQGASIICECRAMPYSLELYLFPLPSYIVGYYSMTVGLKCADVIAGLGNGCFKLCEVA